MTAGNTGTHMAGWFKRPINHINDLKGLKLRVAGLGGDVRYSKNGLSLGQYIPIDDDFDVDLFCICIWK